LPNSRRSEGSRERLREDIAADLSRMKDDADIIAISRRFVDETDLAHRLERIKKDKDRPVNGTFAPVLRLMSDS